MVTVLTSLTPSLSSSHLARPCLLKAAIAPVIYKGTTVDSNILFEERSQKSFISKHLAYKLNLQPRARESVLLTSFEAEILTYRSLDVPYQYKQSQKKRFPFLFS